MTAVQNLVQSAPPLRVGALAEYPYSAALEQRFLAVSRFGDPYQLSVKDGDVLKLPRAVCPIGSNDNRSPGHAVHLACKLGPKNAEQAELIKQVVAFLENGQSGIVQAATGFGKTACALMVIAALGISTMVIVPKDDLMAQWREEAKKFLGLTDAEIGEVRQNRMDVKGKKLVLAMLHSLAIPNRYPEPVYRWPGLIVIDEVHRAAADQLQMAMHHMPAWLRLGLSATPERQDGRELLLYAHIGPVRVKSQVKAIDFKVLRFQSPWTCPRRQKKDSLGIVTLERVPHSPGKVGHILNHMIAHTGRNEMLAGLIAAAYQKGRNVIFFSDMLKHLDVMQALVISKGVPLSKTAQYRGGMSALELDKAKAARVMLATYQKAKEGTDVPWLDTLVFGTPKAEIEQIVGRIRREYPDKKEAVVMDPVDRDSPVFAGYANKRAWWYRKEGAKIVNM